MGNVPLQWDNTQGLPRRETTFNHDPVMVTAFYPGSFDPFTNGHLAILEDALAMFDRVVVAIGVHSSKVGTLSYKERETLLGRIIERLEASAVVVRFDGLVVDACREHGASVLVRGVRDGSDLDYELQMIGMNREMAPALRTVLLPPRASVRHVTGTLVRQIHAMGGDVSPFVPPETLAALRARDS